MTAARKIIWWREAPALRFLAVFLLAWVALRMVLLAMESGLLRSAGEDQRQLVIQRVSQSAADLRYDVGATTAGDSEWVQRQANGAAADRPDLAARKSVSRQAPSWAAKRGTALALQKADRPIGEPNSAAAEWTNLAPVGDTAVSQFSIVSAPVAADAAAVLDHNQRDDAVDAQRLAGRLAMRQLAGWSLSAWALVREKGSAPSLPYAPVAGELAGSQGGVRLAYGFGKEGRLRAYGRAAMALERRQQSEAAVGLTYSPVAAVPLDIAMEQRVKLGREGRSAMAAMVVGGVSGKELAHNFRLDAYGQAGMVGLRSRDAFADGAVVVDRAWNLDQERQSLRIGAVITGAVQPGLSRVDVGPRVTLPLPGVGKGARVAVDWRQRIAGNAQPDRGLALTLGVDF